MQSSARTVRSTPIPDVADLARHCPDAHPHAWIRGGRGLLGWGELDRAVFVGANALRDGADWFAARVAQLDVHDDVHRPGSGPIAFVSGAFAPDRDESVFLIPRVVIGRDETGSWLTYTGDPPTIGEAFPATSAASPGAVTYRPGSFGEQEWDAAVRTIVARISDGDLQKVVLARDVVARTEHPIDPRRLIDRLGAAYPDCWTYSVAGLIGATPELLLRLRDGQVYSRVLAGTEWGPGAAERLRSPKNRQEHEYAATSAVAALRGVTTRLEVPAEPDVLELPNVSHLATELRGEVADEVSACDVAAAMHPTAAVGGTPTDLACEVISEVEGRGRGRYAGPVGWIDRRGDGEFGIALRGGQLIAADAIRLYAGCGIVAGSDPQTELIESERKLAPMKQALDESMC